MQIVSEKILLNDADYKELFSLFCSPTQYEVSQLYSKESDHYFEKEDLQEEYELTQEKREFSIDAWRSVLTFLNRKGFFLVKDGNEVSLSFIEEELSQSHNVL
ncbi:MAG: hypothetical protein ABI857_02835 [Acidobacteriota bacterium]